MHISELSLKDYRNLNGVVKFRPGLTVIVGENNAGKSNVIDAIRLVLTSHNPPQGSLWPKNSDAAHDGSGSAPKTRFEIGIKLNALTDDERGRLLTCLDPSEPRMARVTMRAATNERLKPDLALYGGCSLNAGVEAHALDALQFVYLPPLRHAASELRPGRDNRLVALLSALAPSDEHPDRSQIEEVMRTANDALDQIETIKSARDRVATRFNAMTGGSAYSMRTHLEFEDPHFVRVVGALRAKIGELAALEMAESGLGYNNLLYIAVLMSALAEETPPDELRVLLVEEPEAHLHPHLQDLLIRFLDQQAASGTQVIVTTHSTAITAAVPVEKLTVLSREMNAGQSSAQAIADFPISPKSQKHLARFLDSTKAALFFARGVVLVEGMAEQLLLPVFAERMGLPLAGKGVSVISVGGVAFEPFVELFGADKLPRRLAVITDADPKIATRAQDVETSEAAEAPPMCTSAEEAEAARVEKLRDVTASNELVELFVPTRTLEWDLALEPGNGPVMVEALTRLRPIVGKRLAATLENGAPSPEQVAQAVQDGIGKQKGQFAQELADLLSEGNTQFEIPAYIKNAIDWICDHSPKESD